jgi:cytochrome P450
METCARRYGDLFQVDVGLTENPLVLTSHPEAIQQLFSWNYLQFDSGKALARIIRPMAGAYSIGALDGAEHMRQRRLLLPPFHGKSIQGYRGLIGNLTRQAMAEWPQGSTRPISEVLKDITLQVILQAVFGIHRGERYEKLRTLFSDMMDGKAFPFGAALLYFEFLQVDLGPRSPWGKFLALKRQIDGLLYSEIEERRRCRDTGRTDVLSLLMAARDEQGEAMSDTELRDQLLTLLHSGHSTTNASLSWAFYLIHSHPAVRDRLQAELDGLDGPIEAGEAERLPYLQAVIQETLRMYPVSLLALARISKEPTELLGYRFPTGTVFVPAIYLTHRRADLYPEPGCFRPERFLERQYGPHEFLPFGGGSRMCIGYAFAQLQMKLILATVLAHWELSLADGRPEQPGRRGLGGVKPAGGVPMVLAARRMSPTAVG